MGAATACGVKTQPASEENRGQGPPSQVYLVVQERISYAIELAPWHDRELGPAPTSVSCSVGAHRMRDTGYKLTAIL